MLENLFCSSPKRTSYLDCAGRSLDLTTPQIMGILNLGPDSFSAKNRLPQFEDAVERGIQLAAEGATILDIGGEPTNPTLHPVVPEDLELERLIPVVRALSREIDIPISVDTSKARVMKEAIANGAGFINDVRALTEPGTLEVVAKAGIPVCLMHMRYPHGMPAHEETKESEQIVLEVKDFLTHRVTACVQAGIDKEKIILDPGIGAGNFGKSLQQNLFLLKQLHELTILGLPLLVGTSRKTFIGDFFNCTEDKRLIGSLASGFFALLNGATLLRVHDVKETKQFLRMMEAIAKVEQ